MKHLARDKHVTSISPALYRNTGDPMSDLHFASQYVSQYVTAGEKEKDGYE